MREENRCGEAKEKKGRKERGRSDGASRDATRGEAGRGHSRHFGVNQVGEVAGWGGGMPELTHTMAKMGFLDGLGCKFIKNVVYNCGVVEFHKDG